MEAIPASCPGLKAVFGDVTSFGRRSSVVLSLAGGAGSGTGQGGKGGGVLKRHHRREPACWTMHSRSAGATAEMPA